MNQRPIDSRILLAALAVLVPSLAWAEADGPDYWQVVGVAADDVLNIRAAADPHADKVGQIPPGATCVRNLGCVGGPTFADYLARGMNDVEPVEEKPRWCRVEYRGQNGWVAGRYLAEGHCQPE